jgi:hypothetical protein
LKAASNWALRMSKVKEFPLLFMFFLLEEPHVADERRKVLTLELLRATDQSLDNPYSDITLKVKAGFRRQLEFVIESGGRVPLSLYTFLLGYRSHLPMDTQDIEGRASYLQEMARRAPFLQLAMASDRLSIKLGMEVTVEECVNTNSEALAMLSSDRWQTRFVPRGPVRLAPLPLPLQGPLQQASDPPAMTVVDAWCASIGFDAYRQLGGGEKLNAKHVFEFPKFNVFVTIHWSYGRTLHTAMTTYLDTPSGSTANLVLPLELTSLPKFLKTCLGGFDDLGSFDGDGEPLTRRSELVMIRYAATWMTTARCSLDGAVAMVLIPRKVARAKRPRHGFQRAWE